jgi:glycosyltransferase involved in cell wall biosynthesis
MIIVTTLYNAEKYVEQCLGSIMGQSYTNFKCYITDDMSTDNSVSVVENFISGDNRFILIKNAEKLFQPGNYDQVIRNNKEIDDEEIIVEIDGDDWLPNSKVLERVATLYEDKNVWVANGSFIYSDGRMGFANPPKNIDKIRNERFTATHLRTWRAFLWRAIDENYLKDDTGKYWEVAGDLAFMYPMIEMAGEKNYRFMPEINYVYNEDNPINDHKVNMGSVSRIVNILRNKEKYAKLIR